MKIAVLSFSGNVGKTIISHNLLVHRFNECKCISVDHLDHMNIFYYIEQSDVVENAILDVQINSTQKFIKEINNGLIHDINYYIVPVIPDLSPQKNAITTILSLLDVGVKNEQIKVVLNCVDDEIDISNQFETLINSSELNEKGFLLNIDFKIENTPVFDLLIKIHKNFFTALNDEAPYGSFLKTEKNKEKRLIMSRSRSAHISAKKHNLALDFLFEKLNLI